jgi:hypothetical protein
VNRTTPIRIISFFLLAGCAVLCQEPPSSDWNSLPNAPSSMQTLTRAEGFHAFVIDSAGLVRGTGHPGPQSSFTALYQLAFIQKKSNAYAPSTSGSFMGRASYAASSIFIVRNGSGRARLNASYFLGVLTSVAAQTAYRPSRERSSSATFNSLGSTIGSDAGVNVYHEFGSGIRQIVKRLTPKIVPKIEDHTIHEHALRDGVPIVAKLQSP